MGRYCNWDYKKPFYYLVTLKCLPGLSPLCKFDPCAPWGIDWGLPLTRELAKTIEGFCDRSPGAALN